MSPAFEYHLAKWTCCNAQVNLSSRRGYDLVSYLSFIGMLSILSAGLFPPLCSLFCTLALERSSLLLGVCDPGNLLVYPCLYYSP